MAETTLNSIQEELQPQAEDLNLFERFVQEFKAPTIEKHTAEVIAIQQLGKDTTSFAESGERNLQLALVSDSATDTTTLFDTIHGTHLHNECVNATNLSVADLFSDDIDENSLGGPLGSQGVRITCIQNANALDNILERAITTVTDMGMYRTYREGEAVEAYMYGGLLFDYNFDTGRLDAFKPVAEQLPAPQYVLDFADLVVVNQGENADPTDTDLAPLEETVELHDYSTIALMLEPEIPDEITTQIRGRIPMQAFNTRDTPRDPPTRYPPTEQKLVDVVRKVAKARARGRLSEEVGIDDIEFATALVVDLAVKIGWVDESDSTTERASHDRLKLLKYLERESTDNEPGIPVAEFTKQMEEWGVDADDIDTWVQEMKRKGEIYNPENGRIRST